MRDRKQQDKEQTVWVEKGGGVADEKVPPELRLLAVAAVRPVTLLLSTGCSQQQLPMLLLSLCQQLPPTQGMTATAGVDAPAAAAPAATSAAQCRCRCLQSCCCCCCCWLRLCAVAALNKLHPCQCCCRCCRLLPHAAAAHQLTTAAAAATCRRCPQPHNCCLWPAAKRPCCCRCTCPCCRCCQCQAAAAAFAAAAAACGVRHSRCHKWL